MPTPGSQASTTVGVLAFTLALGGVVVALRVYARAFVGKNVFGADDWSILLAWIFVLIYNICIFIAVSKGHGQHREFLDPMQLVEVIKLAVIGQGFAALAYAPGKVSVAVCLIRVFPGVKLHRFLWALATFNVLGFITIALLGWLQCSPVSKHWNTTEPGHCIDLVIFANVVLAIATVGAATDFVLALVPWWYIPGLQMSKREKAAVGVAMSLGVVAGGLAIVKNYYTRTLSGQPDYAYDTVPLVLWSAGELCAINVAASIPMLRPLATKKAARGYSAPEPKNQNRWVPLKPASRRRTELNGQDPMAASEASRSQQQGIRVEHVIEIDSSPAAYGYENWTRSNWVRSA